MKTADESAFPQMVKVGEVAMVEGGLTKREFFAGLILGGIQNERLNNNYYDDKKTLEIAFYQADLLCSALDAEKEQKK